MGAQHPAGMHVAVLDAKHSKGKMLRMALTSPQLTARGSAQFGVGVPTPFVLYFLRSG